MELHSMLRVSPHNHLGEEKHQMLDLNRRLESYLNHVKLLEEENMLLAKEIQVMRHSNQGALTRRKGLEEELRQARLEVEAAWRDRVLTEMEVGKLTEELHVLDLQRQKEAEAHMKAKTKLDQSRKELEEEQRAQIWLKEKVSHLEHEMNLLIQTHHEDMAHLEATLTHSRTTIPPSSAQRCNQTPNLLQLGHEYSQRAARAWREAAESYQGQLTQLEESLDQAQSHLTQVGQEKRESQIKLQNLVKEVASARDVKLHLEKTVAQQRDTQNHEIKLLQEHLEGLEFEKDKVGQQIEQVLIENRGLLQMKMSLGLEVATYRALLDGESLRGDVSLLKQPRNISITDAVFSPQRVKVNHQSQQLSVHHQSAPLSSVRAPMLKTATPAWSRKTENVYETPKILEKPAVVAKTSWETPYPKIQQDGAVESFRPEEVQEKVTYAEPLSPPNEREVEVMSEDKEENWNNINGQIVESVVSYQLDSCLSSEPEIAQHQVPEEACSFSQEYDSAAGHEDVQCSHPPTEAWVEEDHKEEEEEQEESSDSETEAMLEPTFESRPSSPESEPVEGVFNQETDHNLDDDISTTDETEIRQEVSCSMVGASAEDKLYPDGEEMDTWDSVIEKKVDPKDEGVKMDEEKRQHAEPEEDISPKEPETKQEVQQDDNMASSLIVTKEEQEEEREEGDDEDDSQNVSVSWRTELESDSYAQDNTLADTRPLIRYKSDETDANTQASHMDDSESSDGEQDKKNKEMGNGASKRFGTMEDLCEEAEGETMDEDYNMGYTHSEGRDIDQGTAGSEHSALVDVVSDGHSEEETEEHTGPMVHTHVDYDEELDTDRLVEQELENLSTDSYSTHFSLQHVSEREIHLKGDSVEEMKEEEENTGTEDVSFCEPEMRVNRELVASIEDQMILSDPSSVVHQEDPVDQHEDQENTEKREEDQHNVSMVTHPDVTEDLFGDFVHRPDTDGIIPAGEESLQEESAPTNRKESPPVETNTEFPVSDSEVLPEAPETADWEVLENPKEGFENERFDDEAATIHQEEPQEISPESVPDENDIFMVKGGADQDIHGCFPSGVKIDSWISSLESGATQQPEEETDKQTNQNYGFADSLVWGNLETQNVMNGNTKVDSGKAKKEQEEAKVEVKQVCRNMEAEPIHSEESEAEGELWSSGEEQA